MKKVLLILGAASLLLASCCNSAKQDATCCANEKCAAECCAKKCDAKKCDLTDEQKQACKEFQAKWADFDSQTPDAQIELIKQKKAFLDAKIAARKEKLAECAATVAACEAKFAGFDSLSVAGQKALLDSCVMNQKCCAKKCDKSKTECAVKK